MDKPRTLTPAAAAGGGGRDHSTVLGQEGALVQEKMAAMQILPSGHGASSGSASSSLSPPPPDDAPAPLTLSLQSNSTAGTLLVDDEEPDSPTSPGSCPIPPDGYPPLLVRTFSFGEYGPPPPPVNRDAKSSCTTRPSMDASFQLMNQDDEPPISGDLESDMYDPPDYSVEPWFAVRQATVFAEIALQCHNNDPSNEVKYELAKATVSTYMSEGSGYYAHVNFTARAKQDGSESEEQLFFAELNLRNLKTLTCFRSLQGKEDQVGGRVRMDTEAKGVDLEHCYACDSELKHPRDGASYQAGHRTGRLVR